VRAPSTFNQRAAARRWETSATSRCQRFRVLHQESRLHGNSSSPAGCDARGDIPRRHQDFIYDRGSGALYRRHSGRDVGTYIDNNASGIVNYGERHRCGERISTGLVESTVNQPVAKRFVKKQLRCAVLNSELLSRFQRWFPYVGTRQIGLPWNWLPHHS